MNSTISKSEAEFESFFMAIGIAVLGGIANFFKNGDKPNWPKIFAAIVTSAFSGLLSYEITTALGFDIHTQCVIAGIAGYGGGTLLDETYHKIHELIMKHADNKFGRKD
ncbi:MAG: hypothetical protein IJR63_00855 [Synergistaceae bacterium]|nr:hypothetical protein [Synergistaceae bacterium]